MKRSEINDSIKWALDLLEDKNVVLPPFAYWDVKTWQDNNCKSHIIKETMLGWDVTDFGSGNFEEFGAVLFTCRNGMIDDETLGTPYAEKYIVLKDGQRLPLHHHRTKTEDIINRTGGVLAIKLYNSLGNGEVDYESPVTTVLDGISKTVKAGETIEINKGESITLRPYIYHLFWAKAGYGDLICGEVSSINDDKIDNYNAEEIRRFSDVDEDVKAEYILCNEYKKVLK